MNGLLSNFFSIEDETQKRGKYLSLNVQAIFLFLFAFIAKGFSLAFLGIMSAVTTHFFSEAVYDLLCLSLSIPSTYFHIPWHFVSIILLLRLYGKFLEGRSLASFESLLFNIYPQSNGLTG